MRGQTFLSYALVALATSVHAAPLDNTVDKRDGPLPHELVKVGTVNVVRDYYYRREDVEAA